jgi:hypothetical protein
MRNRGIYIAACLTIARAYIAAGRPGRLPPLPSYEGWSDLVRSSLVWLGCTDPVSTMNDIRGADPVRQARASVFTAWRDEIGADKSYLLSSQLAELADERYVDRYDQPLIRPTLRAALLAVAAQRKNPGQIDALRLGLWLKKKRKHHRRGSQTRGRSQRISRGRGGNLLLPRHDPKCNPQQSAMSVGARIRKWQQCRIPTHNMNDFMTVELPNEMVVHDGKLIVNSKGRALDLNAVDRAARPRRHPQARHRRRGGSHATDRIHQPRHPQPLPQRDPRCIAPRLPEDNPLNKAIGKYIDVGLKGLAPE